MIRQSSVMACNFVKMSDPVSPPPDWDSRTLSKQFRQNLQCDNKQGILIIKQNFAVKTNHYSPLPVPIQQIIYFPS